MTVRLVLLFSICMRLAPLTAQDVSTMSAVQLNTKGFQLYEASRYEESLVYFKASFEKDPDYSYPHYNYACVLSILKKGKDEITEHLLKAFFFEPEFREKYWSDPDLAWFRKDPDTGNPYAEYFQFGKYKTGIDAEVTRKLLLNSNSVYRYVIIDAENYYHYGFFDFFSTGNVQALNTAVKGRYRITGNIIYIEFDAGIKVESENGSLPFRRVVWMLDKDENGMRTWYGFVLLGNSLRPLMMDDGYAGYGDGV